MAFEEISFRSFNEKDTIQAWIYKPIRKPRGIVQIVHGFGEHSRRYLHMILKLNEAGFVVAADDHVGHGKTATESGNWSDWRNQVKTKIYSGYRHEIHNYRDIRDAVEDGMIDFINAIIATKEN
ncbi:hypothetical protein GH811_06830 [Acetobacterium malicum]|uniref:Serine aminopeptidase S33 domain-containing protein n=1 Tax=Acetobacterium malicum TaxID=52692 RepID=A0ABR6YW08_9FIRM|nr:hypothetical protein [Acetobacterium malicum]